MNSLNTLGETLYGSELTRPTVGPERLFFGASVPSWQPCEDPYPSQDAPVKR
jgi:hypothetical protein